MASSRRAPRPRILQWNCNSLRRRQAELAACLPLRDYDVLAFQETYVRAEEVSLPGYIGYSSPTQCALEECEDAPCIDSTHPPGKPRAALYIRATLAHALVPTANFCSSTVECVAATVRVGRVDTSIASVYVRPVAAVSYAFVPALAAVLAPDHVLCGDYNAHHVNWGCAATSVRGRALSDVITTAGLIVINTGVPTFVRRGSSGTVIDLALVSERCSYEWKRDADTAGSDHYPITLSPCHPSRRAVREYSVVRWPLFRELCASGQRRSDFFEHIAECAERASTRCVVAAGSPVPDIKLLNLRAVRRRAQRRAIRSTADGAWTLYNRLDAVCRRHARRLRDRSWTGVCSSLSDPRRRGRGWHIMRVMIQPKVSRLPVLAIAVARGITEADLAELLASSFEPPAVAQCVVRTTSPSTRLLPPVDPALAADVRALCEVDFTLSELERVLLRKRKRSAPGADRITHQMLRNLDASQRRLLLEAYNQVFSSGHLPDQWRSAVVVPVLKRGKPPRELKSYRPISLTSVAGKTMEGMALHRLQWIATARGFFPAEQCGFRANRATADCLAAVVSTLEQALQDGEMAILLLLDVKSAFDTLPHDSILHAVRTLGVEGKLLRYVQAFLADRSFCVRVGKATSSPRPVTSGVPQGSVLSPFLFNVVLAPLIECLPSAAPFPVRAVIYADDIALYVRGPTRQCSRVRASIQQALECVATFIDGIGLALSPAKTEALVIHPRAAPRRILPCLQLRGEAISWRNCVRYLGLTIDNRLRWTPEVRRVRQYSRCVEGVVRKLLARGDGCPPSFACNIYEAMALSLVYYALPLCGVSVTHWRHIDRDHRRVLRMCHGMPRSSRVADTLVEARAWPPSLTADMRALCHIERIHRAPDAAPLLDSLRRVPRSRVGHVMELYESIVVDDPVRCAPWPAPHRNVHIPVSVTLPGMRTKRHTPHSAVVQEAATRIHEDLAGRVHVFSDGSVLRDRSAAAACTAPELGVHKQCRLSYCASSTTAELVGLQLATELLQESPAVESAAIFCDSKPALRLIAREECGPPLAQRVARNILSLRESGCDVVLQWLPAHVGIAGNEAADELAKHAHSADTPLSDCASSYDSARINFRKELALSHPDSRVADGRLPRPLPATGFTRRERAFLLAMRTGTCWPAERRHRLRGSPSPACLDCGEVETLSHLLRDCPAHADARKQLCARFQKLGLPCSSTDQLLFPDGCNERRRSALAAVLTFIEDAGLTGRL